MEPIEDSKTSAFKTRTPGNYLKENILQLNRSINGEGIVKFIKAQRIRRLGQVKRMEVGEMPRKMMEGRPKKKRKTSSEMDERRGSRPESDEDKAVDGEEERRTEMETDC